VILIDTVRAMKKNAPRFARGIIVAALLCGVFVAGVFLEEILRAANAVSIPVDSSEILEVTISASRKPDFLWLGTAWWVDYDSPVPFDLDIGSGSSAQVPAGTHKIFSNHDYSNLDQYGMKFSEDFPGGIVARPTKP
jgi:hypothetical protein